MKIPVRTKNAMLLGNGLIAHVIKLQRMIAASGKPPNQPLLTYTQLRTVTGAKLAMIGIGNPLDELMQAVHGIGVPEAMRGLTMFARPVGGEIRYGAGDHDWHGITARNVAGYRAAVLKQDWSDVAFVSSDDGG